MDNEMIYQNVELAKVPPLSSEKDYRQFSKMETATPKTAGKKPKTGRIPTMGCIIVNIALVIALIIVIVIYFQKQSYLKEVEQDTKKIMIAIDAGNSSSVPGQDSAGFTILGNLQRIETAVHTLREKEENVSEVLNTMEEKFNGVIKERDMLQKERDDLIQIKNAKELIKLDAVTAHQYLYLSDDGTNITSKHISQSLPDNPKRFTKHVSVMGREGFSSGRHYWEVQILQNKGWVAGVARESMNRTHEVTHSPEKGIWAMNCYNGQYNALTLPLSALSPHKRPSKLGVYLDYGRGRLSLYNADTMETLYTFTDAAFTGRIYPYFNMWEGTNLHLV